MNNPRINPGIYPVFRLFLVIRILFQLFTIITPTLSTSQRLPPIPLSSAYFGLVETLFLLGFISWPWLIQKTGRIHLPISLIIATLGPQTGFLLSTIDFTTFLEKLEVMNPRFINEITRQVLFSEQLQLIILLSVPLIIISWQYQYKIVFFYTLVLCLLDIITITMSPIQIGPESTRVFTLVIIKPLLYILIGYIINRLVKEQHQQNTRLEAANRQLASYATTLEQLAISRERNRLAREFHDTLAHTLSAVAVQLEAVSALWTSAPNEALRILQDSLDNTRKGLTETRRAIQSLRASTLEDMGFVLALRNMANSYSERYHFQVNISTPAEYPNLDPNLEHSLYRISEEALRNIARHSKAQKVEISMKFDAGIFLTIQDNGSGFLLSPEIFHEHYGLRGMKEYAEAAGVELQIETNPGQGTMIKVNSKENK